MGRLRAKQDHESLRNAPITRNMARIGSLGHGHCYSEAPVIVSSAQSTGKIKRKVPHSLPPLCRRSDRLKGNSHTTEETGGDRSELVEERSIDACRNEDDARTEDHVAVASEYESLRHARISENKARMQHLGLTIAIRELQDMISASVRTSARTQKKKEKLKLDSATPLRRSDRLKGTYVESNTSTPPGYAPFIERSKLSQGVQRRLLSDSDRCRSKDRGSIYDPVLGICCHFCRQKKLCGEEDCRRCSVGDTSLPCIGKTECSVCHSSNGVLCRACLKVRYGEEMEDVRRKKDWMCPHCIEEKGINPYWICNSSVCLKKRKMVPTGIAIYQARAEGYESVAHLIMAKLKQSRAGC